MATVVYLPKSGRDENLGQGINMAAEAFIKGAERQHELSVLQAINNAPTREEALKVVAASASSARDPASLSLRFHAVNEKFPAGEDEPVKAAVWNSVTGNEHPVYVKKTDLPKLQDPNFAAQVSGQPVGTVTPVKPAKIFEYVDPATGGSFGTFVAGMHPKGTVTKDDFERTRQLEQDKRSEKRLDQTDTRIANTEAARMKHEARMASRDNEDKSQKFISSEQSKFSANIYKDAAAKYGLSLKPDGSIDMATLTGPQRADVQARLDKGLQLLEEGGGKMTWGKAWREVNKAGAEPPKPADTGKPGGLPAGARLSSDVSTIKVGNKQVKAKKVFDASGKQIGWQPQE